MTIIMLYITALITSMVVALLLKLPLLPKEKPIRFSFKTSVLFPTPVLALGIEAIFRNLFGDYIGLAFFAGLFGALLSKYSDKLFGEL
ncbi:energy-converting NiFe hydrogenase A subunit EhaA [Methanocaldococcus fervens]|uniref:Probable [NiFe]-hydrogenase-type-3 Eha complex membrane subunit A n=1 Tax=Methanocaldococcus fervens (strain DSM 4213 / JCM 15782 / AG86) TaxID=573064 RepID=C7P6H3_METFA|nr:energy-converting NiFe hydrogenase A subunit EhaA [Methanocaldococcus fervens]ACV24155.1 membrane protein-like protein [Methanocaldococcus fervens AG86]